MFNKFVGVMLTISIGLNYILLKKAIYMEYKINELGHKLDLLEKQHDFDRILYENSIISPLPSLPCSPLINYELGTDPSMTSLDI